MEETEVGMSLEQWKKWWALGGDSLEVDDQDLCACNGRGFQSKAEP